MFMTPPKTIYRQQQPTRLGPLFQTPSVHKWTRSLRIFDFGAGDNPSQLFELCPLFQLTRVTFDPALPYSSRVKAKRHTLPKSAYYSVQSLDQVSVGESFSPFCSKTKQATRYWQETQPRLPQQTHWHDICWRAKDQSVESAGCQSHPNFPTFFLLLQKSICCFPANFDQYSQLKANNAYFDYILAHK